MKRTILISILVALLMVGMLAVTVSAEEPHTHCVCGGSAVNVGNHTCDENVTWIPISQALTELGQTKDKVNFDKFSSGYYYLDVDVKITSASYIGGNGGSDPTHEVDLFICLNGHNITATTTRVFGRTYAGSSVNICDCSGEQDAQNNWSWDGTVYAGKSSYGAMIYTYEDSVLNIYGGNFRPYDATVQATNGKLINMAMDKGDSSNPASKAAVFNLYNGLLSGGSSTATGGVVNLMHNSKMNMYGGIIEGGDSVTGGNLAINASVFHMYGGLIRGGEAQSGGNVSITTGSATVHGGTIDGGVATRFGGNVYVSSSGTITVSGGTVTGGETKDGYTLTSTNNTAGNGGNIYGAAKSNITITGGTVANGKTKVNPVVNTSTKKYTYDIVGCGGNIFSMGNLSISGGKVYGGEAYGNYGGNIYYDANGYTFTLSGTGKIWGGKCNSDNSKASTAAMLNSYDPCGGSIRIKDGTFNMTGGSIGINDQNQAAGGASNASGEGGNLSIVGGTTTLSGGVIAHGTASKGGNISGSGTYEITGSVVIRDGVATNDGGNITLFSNPKMRMTGGTISGGTAKRGGNICFGGSTTSTSVQTLNITGGIICDGTASNQGGNICNYRADNVLNISGTAQITGGTAVKGGAICNEGAMTLDGAAITGGTAIVDATPAEEAMGGNIYSTGELTLTNGSVSNGTAYQGGNIYLAEGSTASITGTSITGGIATVGDDKVKQVTRGGNLVSYIDLTITGATISGGQATHGGNLYLDSATYILENCTISGGDATLKCDGSTNGNGGNIYSTNTADTTITSCTISGGKGMRGGSIAAWGKVTINSTSVTGGYAYNSGGNIMTFNSTVLNLNSGTVLSGGESANTGGNLAVQGGASTRAIINDGVQILDGTAKIGDCAYLAAGSLILVGDPEIQEIYASTAATTENLNFSAYTGETLVIAVSGVCEITVTTGDNQDKLVNLQGYELTVEGDKAIFSAPKNVYVSNSGSDDGIGTQASPYKTMDHGMDMVADGGTVNIVGTVDVPSWDAHNKSVVITGGNMNITAQTRLNLRDSLHFKNMTITVLKSDANEYFLYCNGYKTVIGEGVTLATTGGTDDSVTGVCLYGGTNADYVKNYGQISGTDLTVLSGVWGYIYGGNNKTVLNGDTHLYVGGTVNKGVDYVSHNYSSKYLILGGSNTADINGTIYMTVADGTTGTSIHGGSAGACSVDSIELDVIGGEGMAVYGGGRGGAQTIGTINFRYQGGTFEQVFGGVLSHCMTGDVNLTITGGKITRRVYGGCYSNCDEGSGEWTADNFVTGKVRVYIGSGANISCDLKDPKTFYLTKYLDRGIFGHSRRAKPSGTDAEDSALIFLDQTAYNNCKNNLHAIDSVMGSIMKGVTTADVICVMSWSADDTADVIYANATVMEDPETKTKGNAGAISASAKLVVGDEYLFEGEAVTPAEIIYTGEWVYEPMVLTYANNDQLGNATVFGTVNGYSVSKVFALKERPNAAQVIVGKQTVAYKDLQEAIDAVPANGYLKLLVSSDEDLTVSKDLNLDLAGNSLTGKITVAKDATLYGMDTTTDDYDCTDGYGKLTNVEGAVAQHHKTSVTGSVRRYLTVSEDEGKTLSFHRIYLGITKMSLNPGTVGVGYQAKFGADHMVQNMLDPQQAFGYSLWLEGASNNKVTVYDTKDAFVTGRDVALSLKNFDVENFGEVGVYAEVYMKLDDGTVITSSEYTYTLRSLLETVEKNIASYNETQMVALQAMCKKYEEFLINAQWDVDGILDWSAPEA